MSYYNQQYNGVKLDPYRVLKVYEITDPAIQHAVKKLLRLGKGAKTEITDVQEAIESLQRFIEMRDEDFEEQRKKLGP